MTLVSIFKMCVYWNNLVNETVFWHYQLSILSDYQQLPFYERLKEILSLRFHVSSIFSCPDVFFSVCGSCVGLTPSPALGAVPGPCGTHALAPRLHDTGPAERASLTVHSSRPPSDPGCPVLAPARCPSCRTASCLNGKRRRGKHHMASSEQA